MSRMIARHRIVDADNMEEVTIKQFVRAIRGLPSDTPQVHPGRWYTTQKEHWLGWLMEYGGPGAYGRKGGKNRDAKFAYNHIVNYEMLLWLIGAAGVPRNLVKAARSACAKAEGLSAKSVAIRRHVPWDELAAVLWGSK